MALKLAPTASDALATVALSRAKMPATGVSVTPNFSSDVRAGTPMETPPCRKIMSGSSDAICWAWASASVEP